MYSNNIIMNVESQIIHISGVIIGIILLIAGVKFETLYFAIPGLLWLVVNYIFYSYGEHAFDQITGKDPYIFALLFMVIPAYILVYLVFKGASIYSDDFLIPIIKVLMILVFIVDNIHIAQTAPVLLIVIIFVLVIIRIVNPEHYDDLHPLIKVDHALLDRSKYLSVIPKYENKSLTDYPEYVNWLKNYSKSNNKILVLHGYHHNPASYLGKCEFGYDVDIEKIKEGQNIFKKAFENGLYILRPHAII
ncbi:MAG: hypothetical protein Hyperionvirus2_43 [Hyperionvirus sp.]|uniref:Uncharacterized protein n=1 Tax=Hyperionvirus sp. TaxID=2487770 RepID=A0A3G5A5Z8_9VIRU|nr:MAG: hypothetical protein Hyperionvirus2_43 [Hyperionvirus sp.]